MRSASRCGARSAAKLPNRAADRGDVLSSLFLCPFLRKFSDQFEIPHGSRNQSYGLTVAPTPLFPALFR